MLICKYIFIVSCFLVLYNYAGYAILAALLNVFRKRPVDPDPNYTPRVSFIVACYNEADLLRRKIDNSLAQEYPADKIEFIFITDGSTDNSPAIVAEYPAVKLLHEAPRQGKSAAVNRAVLQASGDILIFSDANTMLNKEAVERIARHYQHPDVGGVAGEKKVISKAGTNTKPGENPKPGTSKKSGETASDSPGEGEGLYWKYESRLKKIDSDFYSVVGAAGELFSLRKQLYQPLPHNAILDDFVLSLKAAEKGFRIVYEPTAYAMELPSFSIKDEQKRKVRIAAGGFQSIGMLRSLLLFWRHPRLSFLYISHRVLRWTLSPLCLILAFLSNAALAIWDHNLLFTCLFAAQVVFYGLALLACIPSLANHRLGKIFKLPYYFTFMNVSVILGFFRFLKGSQSAVWEKARRAETGILTE